MKICSKCGKEKSDAEFSLHNPKLKNGKLRPDCRVCVRLRSKKEYDKDPAAWKCRIQKVKEVTVQRNKELVRDFLKKNPCTDCGMEDIRVLDFDHVKGIKAANISRLVHQGAAVWRLLEEMAKCVIRCANCHRIKTHYADLG